MAIDTELWRDWVMDRGRSGVLEMSRPELLPPGLQDALEFGRFGLFLPEHEEPSIAVANGGYVEVRVNAGLLSEETVEAGTIRRIIKTGREARHRMFSVPTPLWNRGNARAMLRSAVALYEQLEITKIELQAEGLGKYIWAGCGFDFKDVESRELVNVAMRLFADELNVWDEPLPEFEHPWDVMALDLDDLGGKVLIPAEKLQTALKERGEVRLIGGLKPGEMVPSKALLLYSRYDAWDGVLDLDAGSPSREQFERYVGSAP